MQITPAEISNWGGRVSDYKIHRRERPEGAWQDVATAIETESTLVDQPKGKKLESAFHPSPTYGVPEGLRGFGGRVATASTFAKAMVDKTVDRSDD